MPLHPDYLVTTFDLIGEIQYFTCEIFSNVSKRKRTFQASLLALYLIQMLYNLVFLGEGSPVQTKTYEYIITREGDYCTILLCFSSSSSSSFFAFPSLAWLFSNSEDWAFYLIKQRAFPQDTWLNILCCSKDVTILTF